jgi:Tol biopolymer transport system component
MIVKITELNINQQIMRKSRIGIVLLISLFFLPCLNAQYFGRNKPRYEDFSFEAVQSPHFEIYHYLENTEVLQKMAEYTEQWYQMHQAVLKDTFKHKNPLILYCNHADFQQTNAISGQIGTSTGGVTEGLKNRVVMPMAMSNQQTHHVLGHELVHAFQYHMILGGDSTSLRSLQNLPLWMVEGMAEYLSIGRIDPHTAMWMRDAVLNDDVPEIKKLNNFKYFPYRWGQAFWAFVTGIYGDDIIVPYFMETAKYGLDESTRRVLGVSLDKLSEVWVKTLKEYYQPWIKDKTRERSPASVFINEKNGGHMNIGPMISPNGQYFAFFSEKDLFSLDLYLADARSGKIIRKLASVIRDGHLDDYNSIESAGSWSPDSRQFATVAFRKGKNIIVIKNVENGNTLKEIAVPGITAFNNLAWSPDGDIIILTGLVDGQIDLYAYDLNREKVSQLTNDKYTEMHPAWSPDGQELVFSTDRLSMQRGREHGKWCFNLAIMDWSSRYVQDIDLFPGANNLNPTFDSKGNLAFLSDRDGIRNIYLFDRKEEKTYQLTNVITGVSGITAYAPALSIAGRRDRVLFTIFDNGKYNIHKGLLEKLEKREVDPNDVNLGSAYLPLKRSGTKDIVNKQLKNLDEPENIPLVELRSKTYKPKFKLDYVGGSAGAGVGVNTFGPATGLAGGVDMLFSDILGDHQLYTGLALNGQVYDFAGQFAYINRKSKIAWGASISHIPLRYGSTYYMGIDTLVSDDGEDKIPVDHFATVLTRQFQDRAGVFAQYPFSQTLRLEAGAAFTRYSFRVEQYNNYVNSGFVIAQDREKLPAPDAFSLASVDAALVGDNSYFGLASPSVGYRFRLGAERFTGGWDFWAVTADYRRYFFRKPFTLAVRAMHYGRYGKDANTNDLRTIYVGNPALVRGYSILNFTDGPNAIALDDLIGSKVFVSNIELRLPLTGPKRLAVVSSNLMFTELALFADGGVAWNTFDQFNDNPETPELDRDIQPIYSAGVSVRVNLFGALVLEPYYAFQLRKDGAQGFGFNILPGW